MTLSRRRFLGLAAASLAASACRDDAPPSSAGARRRDTTTTAQPVTAPLAPPLELAADPFTLGVASGDPVADGVVLWTRLAPDPSAADGGGGLAGAGRMTVVWEVAHDESFTALAAAGFAEADPAHAHSVHVDVAGLEPDRWYWYRFRAGEFASPAGRTRTAPAPGARVERLRLALASCQDWEDGYYSAHPHLAAEGVDAVLFVGDYIYEASSPGGVRTHGTSEAVDLAGYRNRYALYKADPGLQAAHTTCPWLVTWDDHEVDDDHAGGGPDPGGVVARRRAAAYQAWWEHQPVRLPAPGGLPYRVHREVRFGELARVLLLDTRQHRSAQGCGGGLADHCPAFDDPARTMLGPEQEAWLTATLPVAPAAWDVLAQQVAMTGAEALGKVNADQWDGYAAARARLLEAVVAAGLRNTVVLSGDLHAALVGDVRLGGRTVATEFVGPSLSSRFPDDLARLFGLLPAVAPAVLWTDATVHGYVVCELTPQRWRADYRVVSSTATPTAPISTLASFVVEDGQPGARRL